MPRKDRLQRSQPPSTPPAVTVTTTLQLACHGISAELACRVDAPRKVRWCASAVLHGLTLHSYGATDRSCIAELISNVGRHLAAARLLRAMNAPLGSEGSQR